MKNIRRQLKSRAKRRFRSLEQLEDRRLLAYSPVDVNPHHNYLFASDVSNDGVVSPRDALMLVNDLNARGARELAAGEEGI